VSNGIDYGIDPFMKYCLKDYGVSSAPGFYGTFLKMTNAGIFGPVFQSEIIA